jgi:hypothetical protein
MLVGMRSTTADDQAFWGRSGATDTNWMQGLAADDDALDPGAFGGVATDTTVPTDPVFDELRDLPGAGASAAPGDDPPAPLPPAACGDFDWDAPTDDLLPSWNLDLG